MSSNEQNQEQAGGHGREATAHAEGGERGERHGRGRRRGGRPPQQGSRPQPPQGRPGRGDSTLNLEELRELTELFSAHGLTDFEFENADIRIRLSRNPAPPAATPAPAPLPVQAPAPPPAPAPAAPTPAPAETPAPPAPEPVAAEDLHIITSPIPGTFYRAPSPTADVFVNVGSQIKLGQVVCIIEAMKLMNEIEADVAGTVEKIYVENAQPVEYGQPLFGIKLQ